MRLDVEMNWSDGCSLAFDHATNYTTQAKNASTGAVSKVANKYKVVCDSLNVRAKPSLGNAVVVSYSRSERCDRGR